MPVILFVDGQQKVRVNVLVRQMQSCLSFSTSNKIDFELFVSIYCELFSQYNPNWALKYELSKKGHYFTVRISYFETKINKNRNISI